MIRPLIAIALAASVVTAPAFAASDEFRMQVEYKTADLNTPEQAAAEYDRIREDVHKRCVSENAVLGTRIVNNVAAKSCEAKLMQKIVARIDNDNFTAAHEAAR